jgi:hypothetical protein
MRSFNEKQDDKNKYENDINIDKPCIDYPNFNKESHENFIPKCN